VAVAAVVFVFWGQPTVAVAVWIVALLAAISPTALLLMAVYPGSASPRTTALMYVAERSHASPPQLPSASHQLGPFERLPITSDHFHARFVVFCPCLSDGKPIIGEPK
jgi:hypothetical protein